MANATSAVAASKVSTPIERIITEPLDAAAGKVYTGVLVARDGTGYYTPADDSQALTEVGVHAGPTVNVDSTEEDGSSSCPVERGCVIPVKIASLGSDAAARAAYGKPVYVKYSDECQLSEGTYGNFLGFIVGHNSLTEALVFIPLAPTSALGDVAAGDITMGDAKNIVVNTTTGTKIGTAASQKLGFFNATPVVQQTKAGHNNWAQVSDVVSALVSLGLFDQA